MSSKIVTAATWAGACSAFLVLDQAETLTAKFTALSVLTISAAVFTLHAILTHESEPQ